jgi:hypothetical protein
MEGGTENIHACFPAETEGDSSSPHDEFRESTKQARDSTSSCCFGWVRTWLCDKNNLDIDDDFSENNYPENTGDGSKHSRDWSTGGCFEWIRRWVREKVPRNSGKDDRDSPATDHVGVTNV